MTSRRQTPARIVAAAAHIDRNRLRWYLTVVAVVSFAVQFGVGSRLHY